MSAPASPPRGLAALLAVLALLSRLVPEGRAREAWVREWRAELWHRWASAAKGGAAPGPAAVLDLVFRLSGALPDALVLRRAALGATLPPALRALAGHPARTLAAALALTLAVAMNTLGFALASRLGDRLSPLVGLAALALGMALAGAAARAAAGVLRMEPMPDGALPFPTLRATRAAQSMLLAVAAAIGGVLLAVLASTTPPGGAIDLPPASFAFGVLVSFLAGRLLARAAALRSG